MLSHFRLLIGEQAAVAARRLAQPGQHRLFTANLTNLPLTTSDGKPTPQGVIHIERSRLLWQDRMYRALTLSNYGERETDRSR